MNILKKLNEPVPFNLNLHNHMEADAAITRPYVSDPGTLDKYCPGLTDTVVTPDAPGHEGVYQSTMKFLGVGWRADMQYHHTDDGAVLHGTWKGPMLPTFGETLTLKVQPSANGQGCEFSKIENYTFPRFLKPIFPMLRWSLTRVSHQAVAKLDSQLLAGQASC